MAARPAFFGSSIVPVAVAGAYVRWTTGKINLGLWLLIALAMLLLHIAGDLFYEYFDSTTGAEDLGVCYISPFTGSGRAIQRGLVAPHEVLFTALVCLALGTTIGLYLTVSVGPVVFALGAFGALSMFFYSAPPLRLIHHGVGEIISALDFGVLPMLGTQYVLAHQFTWQMLIISLPVALLILGMTLVNRFPDCETDALVGKRHLVVLLGRPVASLVILMLYAVALAILVVTVAMHWLPTAALLGLLAVVPAGLVVLTLVAEPDDPAAWCRAAPAGVFTHLVYGVAVFAVLLLATPIVGR